MSGLTGSWRYRSFVNHPAPVTSADQAMRLIFGEGALTIETADPEAGFKATLSFGGDAVMDLVGDVRAGQAPCPLVAAAQGRGRPGSPIAAFAYDYIFYLVPAWPDGVNQRDALIGTVIRAADHGSARKGVTASTITVRLDD